MASYELDVIMWCACLVTLHMYTNLSSIGPMVPEAELNRTSIFHRMRNIVPLHRSKPLAICVVQHLEYQRNWRRLIRISYLGWVKFYFFPLLAKYSQRARPKRNAYFIHKTISVREKIAQIHTNTQRSYCDVMPLLRMVRNCTTVEWYAASQRLSSNRRVHNKLSRCCTIRNVKYESLWDNLGMSDIICIDTNKIKSWYLVLSWWLKWPLKMVKLSLRVIIREKLAGLEGVGHK